MRLSWEAERGTVADVEAPIRATFGLNRRQPGLGA